VGDIMTRNFVSIKPHDSLHICMKKIVREKVNSLIVSEGKKLVGIMTARDILWTLTKKPFIDLKKIRAIDIATRKVAVIKPSADISEAIRKMQKLNFRRLPVLHKGELIGVVTLKDILAVEPELYSEIQELIDLRGTKRKLERTSQEWPEIGECENCGTLTELTNTDGEMLCIDCANKLH